MIPLDSLWLLVLFAIVGGACFRAGWLASHAHLSAAKTVTDVTLGALDRSNNFATTLDKTTAEVASLRGAVEQSTGVVGGQLASVEELLRALIVGLEQAQIIRTRPRDGGRASTTQVGEKPSE